MSASKPFYVCVDGEQVQGWVARNGHSYRAWGMFRGREIIKTGSSELSAIDGWRESANYASKE